MCGSERECACVCKCVCICMSKDQMMHANKCSHGILITVLSLTSALAEESISIHDMSALEQQHTTCLL